MPGRNVIKNYRENGVYHIYNRGVEKRIIFKNKTDQKRFLTFLYDAINRYGLTMLNYTLMPNHFHLLVKQTKARGIEKLMRSLCTRYALYFNFKYDRVGSLFQGAYRARLIESDEDLLIVNSYIDGHEEDTQGETLTLI